MLGVRAHNSNNDNVTVGNQLKRGIFRGDMNLFQKEMQIVKYHILVIVTAEL